MKIVEFEITKAELCEIVEAWWVEHHVDPVRVEVWRFDPDQLETISFRKVEP